VPMNRGIIVISCLMILTFFLCGCSSLYKEPEITVQNVELADITPTDLILNVSLAINNPNMYGITLDTLICNVSYKNSTTWAPMTQISMHNIQIISGPSSLEIPVQVKNADLIKAGFGLLKDREITLMIEGTAKPAWYGISLPVPFSFIKTIPFNQSLL
jgi:LEA14-like dessication related protein